jgi:hypothetical protein
VGTGSKLVMETFNSYTGLKQLSWTEILEVDRENGRRAVVWRLRTRRDYFKGALSVLCLVGSVTIICSCCVPKGTTKDVGGQSGRGGHIQG